MRGAKAGCVREVELPDESAGFGDGHPVDLVDRGSEVSSRGQQAVDTRIFAQRLKPVLHLVAKRDRRRPDVLVDRPQHVVRALPDRAVERIANDEAGHNQGGSKQRAEDDEHALGRPARDLTQRETAQHWAAYQKEKDEAGGAADDNDQWGRELWIHGNHATATVAFALSLTSRPSRMWISRLAAAPIVGSWVTSTIVWPSSAFNRVRSAITCAAMAVS